MKKLNLNLDGVKAQLTKEQMKKINGGYYICGCYDWDFDEFVYCGSDYDTCMQFITGQCAVNEAECQTPKY